MKISLPTNYKSTFTLDDLADAKTVIKNAKEFTDEESIGNSLKSLFGYACDVLKMSFEVTTNYRIDNDRLCEGSGCMDIEINATIDAHYIDNSIYIVSCVLTDLWDICYDNKDEIKERMYIRQFKEV